MKCIICKQDETRPGKTTITLEREGLTIVFKNTPAQICVNCGEAYVDEQVTAQLLGAAEEATRSKVLVDIREFTPART